MSTTRADITKLIKLIQKTYRQPLTPRDYTRLTPLERLRKVEELNQTVKALRQGLAKND